MKKNEVKEVLGNDSLVFLKDLVQEIKSLRKDLRKQGRPDNKRLDVFDMDYTPSPFSKIPITTQNEALEQILVRTGMMSRETWEVLAGIKYDAIGDNIEDDSFLDNVEQVEDGEFEQSRFASYYERKKIEVPNIETKKIDVAPAPAPAPEPTLDPAPKEGEK